MKNSFRQVQPAMAYAVDRLDGDVGLGALAERTAMSPFHMHRVFSAVADETPKQYTARLRLGRAASLLLTGRRSVMQIALICGFETHEGFTRAFRRQFGIAPSVYRARGFARAMTEEQARAHDHFVRGIGPCIAIYHIQADGRPRRPTMSYSITKEEISAQPVLIGRRRVSRSEIAAAIGDVLPRVFRYAQERGIAITGRPFVRYTSSGPGLITLEPGLKVALPEEATEDPNSQPADTDAENEIRGDVLPGGFVATTMHSGPYEMLHEAYAAIETWMEAQGLVAAGTPWESYITDPTTLPDPKDWRTEVCWPVQ